MPSDPSPRPPDGEAAVHATEVPPEPAPPAEPRQRWRLTFARDPPPADEVPTGRDYIGRWEESLLSSGLPVAVLASGRPARRARGAAAERMLGGGRAPRVLADGAPPAWAVREGITATLPAGHRAAGLENVWLGSPALSGQIAAADYEVDIAVDGLGPSEIAGAVDRLLAHERLPRERQKGGTVRTYDLRPLIAALDLAGEAPAIVLRMRTRIHPELGTGRPDEVVAALAEDLGAPIAIRAINRRRLLLAEDLVA